jgi:hypothetical protein
LDSDEGGTRVLPTAEPIAAIVSFIWSHRRYRVGSIASKTWRRLGNR